MDPLASISAAASILGVIQFGGSLLKTVREIYQSTSGLTAENANIELACLQLAQKADGLGRFAKDNIQSFPSGEDGEELIRISEKCVSATSDILRSLDKVRAKQQTIEPTPGQEFTPGQKAEDVQRRRFKAFRQALKVVWKKDEAAKASKTLSDLREQLEFHMLTVLQKVQVTSSVLADYRFQALQKSNQDLIQTILENRNIFVEEIRSRVDIIQKTTESALLDAVARINERIPSNQEIEAAVRRSLLDSLRFSSISQRYEEVAEAHRSTYEWIFRAGQNHGANWSNFPEWLQSGSGLYWISGKAASGKSTLMRYILDNGKAYELLRRWAPESELDTFTFFFWNSGTIEQRSLLGIYRSILHQYLSKHPEKIELILPHEYDSFYSRQAFRQDVPEIRWTIATLQNAFEILIESAAPRRLCLFIDGLDEYEGDHAAMAQFLMKIGTHEHVKICVSSRPWLEFEKVFKSCPTLRLQDLTKSDISIYVDDRLGANERWAILYEAQPDDARNLIQDIVKMANGVFLWVKLVLNSLLKGLDLDDDFEDLSKRLRCLPAGLEQLYSHMLKTIDPPFYLEEAAMFFETLRTARQAQEMSTIQTGGEEWSGGVMSLAALALTDRKNVKLLSQYDSMNPRDGFLRSLCRQTENRLKSRCMGLLEINGPQWKAPENHTVSYIHRTLRDFLERPQIRAMLQDAVEDEQFSPTFSLARSCIFYLQLTLPNIATSPSPGVWQSVQLSMTYASMTEDKHGGQLHPLLNQLDSMMTDHQKKYDKSDLHWSTERLLHGTSIDRSGQEHDTFLSFCIEQGVFTYVRSILLHDPGVIQKKSGRPLLHFAVLSLIKDPSNETRAWMCKMLLEHGASPNQTYDGLSPWSLVMIYLARHLPLSDTQRPIWLDLVTAFIIRDASMTVSVASHNSNVTMTAKSVLEMTFLLPPRPDSDTLRRLLEEHPSRYSARQLSSRALQPDMRKGWTELERAHIAARSSVMSVQNYGTFNETETPSDSSGYLATLGIILCCCWGVEANMS
ncbi:hypothetical protein F4677DRAFT_42993 [Hypoxylon crocopeplum]|nr:hypothetical protein F4677DRAFT_42993 [Hypoxylon crocopeplum]